ncbi:MULTISPECIES: L-histidine N(alpha)-methyltransferase [unclassified Dietzia]|uniref:L-histidine N(alpha)-methyltransferase n=1 Tax=unclassified Dietzia TaxID=2617939 RepID=UPI0015FD61EC|nr:MULTISPECIES: L-histidine N(alpha)-methyltransferase [unclassified Dietzia]MBB1025596.1 L-histidine N(alpha)-methyltransferase [Dietzia sp. DQ12-76]MBB1028338.1 L-histidine N(alpha)-methyltransferase [Dietzia sp. DQ11-38-2]
MTGTENPRGTTTTTTTTTTTRTPPADPDTAALESDLRDGFFADPPTVPPRWFYDEKGSVIFDQITRVVEYYPTRAEAEILTARAREIVAAASTVVELGAGTCEKTRVLLDVLTQARADARFVPVDISSEMLVESSRALGQEYPGLRIDPVIGDITALEGPLPGEPGGRLVLFLGGTVGNFSEKQRAGFFRMLRALMAPGDRLALGFDLVKNPDRLVAAYDDAAGVTAEFNLNMLDVIARTVDCTGLDRRDFRHEAVWNETESRIEMWLRAVREVRIDFPTLERGRTLAAGDGIRTEIARKFEPRALVDELAGHGFGDDAVWTDTAGDFGLAVVVVG